MGGIVYPLGVDSTRGLDEIVANVFGPKNPDISEVVNSKCFKISRHRRMLDLEIEPFLPRETGEVAAKRLVKSGFVLEGIVEQIQFMAHYPEAVGIGLVALAKSSRLIIKDGLFVPFAAVSEGRKIISMAPFSRLPFGTARNVLVSRPTRQK